MQLNLREKKEEKKEEEKEEEKKEERREERCTFFTWDCTSAINCTGSCAKSNKLLAASITLP
jgi:succinate dehydrogenase/fumarate reductase-like Fe-S protein